MEIGFGELRLNPISFYSMTTEELFCAIHGARRVIEMQERSEWERMRMQTFYLLQPQVKKNSLRKPTQLMKFDWDQVVVPAPTQREFERAKDRINDRDAKWIQSRRKLLNK